MPQMAPYNWLYLNLLFLLIFMIYTSMMYFSSPTKSLNKMKNFKKLINKFNYKW